METTTSRGFPRRCFSTRRAGSSSAVRARRSRHIPTVLSRDEIRQLFAAIDALDTDEPYGLVLRLMYGTGMRLHECLSLRVKDIDFERGRIIVRRAKGGKDCNWGSAVGGHVRNRTGIHGFAIRCVTTPPCGPNVAGSYGRGNLSAS